MATMKQRRELLVFGWTRKNYEGHNAAPKELIMMIVTFCNDILPWLFKKRTNISWMLNIKNVGDFVYLNEGFGTIYKEIDNWSIQICPTPKTIRGYNRTIKIKPVISSHNITSMDVACNHLRIHVNGKGVGGYTTDRVLTINENKYFPIYSWNHAEYKNHISFEVSLTIKITHIERDGKKLHKNCWPTI